MRAHLCGLQHGRQRSRGVGGLYRHYQDQISRRDLQPLTETVRRELAHQRQAELRHITWEVPGMVWSLDDAKLARFAHHKLHLHQVQDLASRYKFTPLLGERVLGDTVAVYLEQLFLRHGPPLVLTRKYSHIAACPKSTLLIPSPESGYILNGLTALPPVTLCMARYARMRSPSSRRILSASEGRSSMDQRTDPGA